VAYESFFPSDSSRSSSPLPSLFQSLSSFLKLSSPPRPPYLSFGGFAGFCGRALGDFGSFGPGWSPPGLGAPGLDFRGYGLGGFGLGPPAFNRPAPIVSPWLPDERLTHHSFGHSAQNMAPIGESSRPRMSWLLGILMP
jgi:hypothetical protein